MVRPHGGSPRACCTRGRVPLGLGVFPYGVLARYTHSKPRLVLHLPVTNDKWLGGPPLEKRVVGVLLGPWLIATSLGVGSGAMDVENCARVRVMVKHENKS